MLNSPNSGVDPLADDEFLSVSTLMDTTYTYRTLFTVSLFIILVFTSFSSHVLFRLVSCLSGMPPLDYEITFSFRDEQ